VLSSALETPLAIDYLARLSKKINGENEVGLDTIKFFDFKNEKLFQSETAIYKPEPQEIIFDKLTPFLTKIFP